MKINIHNIYLCILICCACNVNICRVQIPKSTHRRRSDNFITNGIQKVSKFPLPRGFSFNLALLAWAIASGFLLQFFDSLLLTGQMKPKYSNFVKNRKDLIDSNMTLGSNLKYILTRSFLSRKMS